MMFQTGYRAKIILLKDDGYTVPEIRKITNHHDNNIRKWIYTFNEYGIDGIISKIHTHKPNKFTDVLDNIFIHKANKVRENYTKISSKNKSSISTNQISRSEPDRGKMVVMDAKTSDKQFYI